MALTVYKPAGTKQAGNVLVALGPKHTNLKSPSLAAMLLNVTCALGEFATTTDLTMTEVQRLCDPEAKEKVEKRLRKLNQTSLLADKDDEAALLGLLVEDGEVGITVRPYLPSTTDLQVADKVWTFNAKVGSLDPNPIAVGNEFEWLVNWQDVERELAAVVVA